MSIRVFDRAVFGLSTDEFEDAIDHHLLDRACCDGKLSDTEMRRALWQLSAHHSQRVKAQNHFSEERRRCSAGWPRATSAAA